MCAKTVNRHLSRVKWTLDEWANTLKYEDKVLVTLSSFPAQITRTICVTSRVYNLCDKHLQREESGCQTVLFLQNFVRLSQKS